MWDAVRASLGVVRRKEGPAGVDMLFGLCGSDIVGPETWNLVLDQCPADTSWGSLSPGSVRHTLDNSQQTVPLSVEVLQTRVYSTCHISMYTSGHVMDRFPGRSASGGSGGFRALCFLCIVVAGMEFNVWAQGGVF